MSLKTWKEIAGYLGVSIRTAQNWEREKNLPIRRFVGDKSQVWALRDELDRWLSSQENPYPPDATAIDCNSARAILASDEDGTALPATLTNRVELNHVKLTLAEQKVDMYLWHLALCCMTYAVLYVLDLFLEVAYRFDQLGRAALFAAPPLAIWIAATSAFGLRLGWLLTQKGTKGGFAAMFAVFAAAGLLGWAALNSILPPIPITLLRFPAQTAQAAYFKNIALYFFPMVTIAWLVPFHFVSCRSWQNRRQVEAEPTPEFLLASGSLYIPPRWLASAVLAIGIISIFLTQDLLRNLRPGPYINLFMLLAIAKSFVYFALGALCVAWYVRALEGSPR